MYDTPGTDLVAGPETDDRRCARPDVNLYDREAFEFNSYAPRAGLFYNRNDGFGLSLGVGFVRQGFRKPYYKNRYDFALQASTGGQLQLTASTRHRYAIGKVAIGAAVSYGNFFPFYNYFGIGNNTQISQDLYDARYYRARYKGFTVSTFFERAFLQRSMLRVRPSYE